MNWTSTAAASAIALTLAVPAWAEGSSAGWGKGGDTREFAAVVRQYNQSGERFRIRGHCQSACTMFLAIRNVCIEPGARLLFHAGGHPNGTARMFNSYNASLKSYLTDRRVMESPTFHAVSDREMISRFGYRACPRV